MILKVKFISFDLKASPIPMKKIKNKDFIDISIEYGGNVKSMNIPVVLGKTKLGENSFTFPSVGLETSKLKLSTSLVIVKSFKNKRHDLGSDEVDCSQISSDPIVINNDTFGIEVHIFEAKRGMGKLKRLRIGEASHETFYYEFSSTYNGKCASAAKSKPSTGWFGTPSLVDASESISEQIDSYINICGKYMDIINISRFGGLSFSGNGHNLATSYVEATVFYRRNNVEIEEEEEELKQQKNKNFKEETEGEM